VYAQGNGVSLFSVSLFSCCVLHNFLKFIGGLWQVFEDKTARLHSPERFFVQIGLSPGVAGDAMVLGKKHLDCQPMIWCVLCKVACEGNFSLLHISMTVSAGMSPPSETSKSDYVGILEEVI
jgi:hypothetical protein